VNVTVTGTTLPPVPPMSGAYHQAQVNAIWNGTSNWLYGPHVCTSCNVNFNNSWSFSGNDTCFLDLIGCSLETMPQVYCSFVGVFWVGTTAATYLEKAGTYDQANGAGTPDGTFAGEPVYQYNVVHYCTNGTPDYNPSTLLVNEPNAATDRYFFANATLFRFSKTSTWSVLWPTGGATTSGGSQKASPPTPCTHTGPQK
jgi:hypothetical protein